MLTAGKYKDLCATSQSQQQERRRLYWPPARGYFVLEGVKCREKE